MPHEPSGIPYRPCGGSRPRSLPPCRRGDVPGTLCGREHLDRRPHRPRDGPEAVSRRCRGRRPPDGRTPGGDRNPRPHDPAQRLRERGARPRPLQRTLKAVRPDGRHSRRLRDRHRRIPAKQPEESRDPLHPLKRHPAVRRPPAARDRGPGRRRAARDRRLRGRGPPAEDAGRVCRLRRTGGCDDLGRRALRPQRNPLPEERHGLRRGRRRCGRLAGGDRRRKHPEVPPRHRSRSRRGALRGYSVDRRDLYRRHPGNPRRSLHRQPDRRDRRPRRRWGLPVSLSGRPGPCRASSRLRDRGRGLLPRRNVYGPFRGHRHHPLPRGGEPDRRRLYREPHDRRRPAGRGRAGPRQARRRHPHRRTDR